MYLRGKIARIKCVQISERKAPGRTDGRTRGSSAVTAWSHVTPACSALR